MKPWTLSTAFEQSPSRVLTLLDSLKEWAQDWLRAVAKQQGSFPSPRTFDALRFTLNDLTTEARGRLAPSWRARRDEEGSSVPT